MGIVPEHEISRLFRDRSGELHQQLGAICSAVYFVAAGLPLALKGELPDMDYSVSRKSVQRFCDNS